MFDESVSMVTFVGRQNLSEFLYKILRDTLEVRQ